MKVVCLELDALAREAEASGRGISRAKAALLASTADDLILQLTSHVDTVRPSLASLASACWLNNGSNACKGSAL